jgi:hypothetical protein
MPNLPEIKRELDLLNGDVLATIEVWDTWQSLFQNADETERKHRLALAKSSILLTEPFFGQLSDVLMRDIIISLYRLFDDSSGSLSLHTMAKQTALLPKEARPIATALLSEAVRKHQPAKLMRTKLIGHRDREYVRITRQSDAVSIGYDDIRDTIRLATEFLDIFNENLQGQKAKWNRFYEDTPLALFAALAVAEHCKTKHGLFT